MSDRRRYQAIRLPDPEAQRAQEEARDATDALNRQPFMQAVHHIIPSIPAGSAVTISHKLGRAPRGWWIADCTGGPPLVHRLASNNQSITLHNSHTAPIGVAIWVY